MKFYSVLFSICLLVVLVVLDVYSTSHSQPSPQEKAASFIQSGNLKIQKADLTGAIDDYTKAINADPTNVDAYNDRATAKVAVADFKGAVADCTKAIELTPHDPDGYNKRGIIESHCKDYDDAIDDFTEAIKLAPEVGMGYLNRGDAEYDSKDYTDCIGDFTKVVQLDPSDVYAFGRLTHAKKALGGTNQ